MSAKWRALQHRHRYTYSAVIFPQSYIDALNQFPVCNFYSELKQLISLNSTYAQVNHVKKVAFFFSDLLINCKDDDLVSQAARFYLEILFLENSFPLHRTLVSVLAKSRNFQSLIGSCFRLLCDEYGGVNGKGKRFCVSRVALSMMSSPKLGFLLEVIQECAVLVALDVVSGLNSIVSEPTDWSRPSPIVMDQCQEALSCVYYLLQRFPSKFTSLNGNCSDMVSEGSNVLELVLSTILSILKSPVFSRDCLVAAGVSFFAALQVCLVPEELGLAIMEGIFFQTNCNLVESPQNEVKTVIFKVSFRGDLYYEIRNLSVLSRLCLIRGILTAVSRTVLNVQFVVSSCDINEFQTNGDSSNSVQTILFDGILPELCKYCENPTDSHFNFHTLTILQICLQQIKTTIQGLCNPTEDCYPISEDMGARILRIIWNNLEDPLSQTVKQVHLIFDLFLDIQSTLHWSQGSDRIKSSLQRIASDLLRMGPRCKGRYVPLASLTKRLGAKTMLDLSPDLLLETAQAYIDDDVCCAATTFLKCFLECLRDECWGSDGIESGYAKYRGHCLPPFLFGLASGVSKHRSNLNTYALPVILELDVDAIFPMLAIISAGQVGEETELIHPELSCINMSLRVEQKVAILVSLLKVSRFLALLEGDIDWFENSLVSQEGGGQRVDKIYCYAVFSIKGIKVKVLAEWLAMALTHVDESLRIDAAESLFLNPKTSSLPSRLELSLMKEAVPLNMRCCSTAFQMKWASLFRKFFSRVRSALERQMKQGSWQPLAYCEGEVVFPCKRSDETAVDKAEDLFYFIRWMSSFLFFSCYPSAPYERKIMAMELILIMINVWSIVPPSPGKCDLISSNPSLCPYSKGFTSPDSTLLLVGSIVDSWDRLRESSFRILLHFPTPLPGICSQNMVQRVITWAKHLVCSPRVRESDAGALTMRLIFRKYVLDLGWMVRPSCNIVSFHSEIKLPNGDTPNGTSTSPEIVYVTSLIDWLRIAVEECERDLSEACKKSFVHGVLLTLRYTFEELDWNSNVVLSSLSEMRLALEKLLQLVMRITSQALWVVSADAWYLNEDIDDMGDDDAFLPDFPADMYASESASEHEVKNSKLVSDERQSEQVVMVGCWLAMKEVSLLLGTIIRKIPLPTSDSCSSEDLSPNAAGAPIMASDLVLDLKQLETIGNHFLEVLLKMKHNGAIDKTRAGFTALCNRLLCSNDPRLCKLTDSWIEQLMKRIVAKGQTVDDLLRRSAGIPAAFTALFLSEPEGTPKRLLPRALRWLIDLTKGSLLDPTDANTPNSDSCNSLPVKSNRPTVISPSLEMDVNGRTSKIRDEGVVPTVHAFNVLRAAFNDANLATDTSGFSAEALIVSIRSFSSSYWEVRNSACLAYTALVRRMVGFLNIQKRESARRALTGLEFFHRYPALHTFLFNELRVATELLNDMPPQHPESNLAKVVHPSLCPMLIILSRLKPSTISSEAGDTLDPFLYMPFIRRCSIQSNFRVRVLASRALAGLVSNEKLPVVLLNIASELPCRENQMISVPVFMNDRKPNVSFNSIHGTLLQLSSLLETNCMNLADFAKRDQIIGDLIQVLVSRAWIGKPKLCPCPSINCALLKVVDTTLSIARTCHRSENIGPIWNLLWELSSECLNVEATRELSYYDPSVVELRKRAANSYFNCICQTSKEVTEDFLIAHKLSQPVSHLVVIPEMENASLKFQESLVLYMSDDSYEVRIATLKWLLLFLKAAEPGMEPSDQYKIKVSIVQWINTNLQETLLKRLAAEKNHKCTYYILRIIFVWNLLQFQKKESKQCAETVYVDDMDYDSVLQFWEILISLYERTRHGKTRETLVCCMGICVKRIANLLTISVISKGEMTRPVKSSKSDLSGRLGSMYDSIAFYVNLIEQRSASSEPVNMRKAAAESLVASGLLEKAEVIGSLVVNSEIPSENLSPCREPNGAVNMYAHKVLGIWFTCIKLMEDEDFELRRKLAINVQKCFASKKSGENSQVEKVIELSFEHLSSIFGNWLEYFNYLSQWVLNAANCVISTGDLIRRVFDKEIDNHHEEKLLICQICCSHLEKLPVSKLMSVDFSDKFRAINFLFIWRRRFFDQLMTFAKDYVDKQGGVDWIGTVGNHKDAFLPLYANLLGFYALSNCIFTAESTENGKSLLADAVGLVEFINPFLRNPLILNLYLSVVKLHEKMAGPSSGNLVEKCLRDGSSWDGFDPYFLLR